MKFEIEIWDLRFAIVVVVVVVVVVGKLRNYVKSGVEVIRDIVVYLKSVSGKSEIPFSIGIVSFYVAGNP